jgi:serine/threonine protein phosphatase 1
MSDIHGCLKEFEEALSKVLPHIENDEVKLLLLGDYVHGGINNREVLDKIMFLQYKYGNDKIKVLMGNHETWILDGSASIDHMSISSYDLLMEDKMNDNKYINWMKKLPLYFIEGQTIFVHAGIDEEACEYWEWGTDEDIFTGKYPAQTGKIHSLDMKIVAGHVGTASISRNPEFNDIYFDGDSHYYIDGTVTKSGKIPVLMVDTETDKYYSVTQSGNLPILSYDEEN